MGHTENLKSKINLKKRSAGFSLIEILIALGLIAFIITSFGRPSRSRQNMYRNYFRQLSLMSKQIKNRAQIERATYRMVFYMQDDEPTEITVEKSESVVLLGSERETEELYKKLLRQRQENEDTDEESDEDKEPLTSFQPSERFEPDNLNRPKDLVIKQIEISGINSIFDGESLAAFHYFKNGFVEEVLIQVETEDKALKWTLLTDPLTGEIYTIGGHKTLEEIKKP